MRKNIFLSFAVPIFSLLLGAHAALAQNVVQIISSWNGDVVSEETAGDVIDGNNGALLGGVTTVPEENGDVFQFDGSSGRIDMGNPANLNFGTTDPFSLEAWFNWDGGGKSSSINIIRKSNYPFEGPGAGYWLRIGKDTSVLEFFTGETVGYGNPPSGRVTTPIEPNTWYHAIATRDGAGTMRLYVNDELRGTAKAQGADTTSEAPFTIGAWDDRFGITEVFSGMIGEITVYGGALNTQEVRAADEEDPEREKEIADIEKKLAPFIKKGKTPGQCGSFDECQAYCNIEENFSECTLFAKKIGIDEQEIPLDQQPIFRAMEAGEGPGGCKDESSCRAYCEDVDKLSECIAFVEKFNVVSPDELAEMRKVAEAKAGGVPFPGNCKTKESCMKYCEGPAHTIECMEFGLATGLMPKEDAEAVNKILPYLKSGGRMPGGCTTKESCDAYCESDDHTNECVDFAVAAGFVTKEEAEMVKKVGGKGPGNCKSREQCDAYCKDETHIDECIDFAVKAGFMSSEEAEMARKFGITSGGPGDCKSKAECQSFCAVKENQETCVNWAKEHGMDMSGGGPGEAGFSGPGGCKNKEECTAYCTANHEDEECKKMIQEFGGQGGAGGGFPGGPGGCKTPDECMAYCKDHQEECRAFAPPGVTGGQSQTPPQGGDNSLSPTPLDGSGGFSGPGGCKTPEECQAYCMQNYQDPACQQYAPPSGSGSSDPSAIPQGYSSWEEFCKAQQGDSRCTAYQPQLSPSGDGGSGWSGPGGCKTPEECTAYCTQNYQDPACQQFAPPQTSSSLPPPSLLGAVFGPWLLLFK